jgi:small G protein signaling modulator 3
MVDGVIFPRIEEPRELDHATPTASKIVVHPASEPAPSAGAGTTENSTRPQDHDLADAISVHSSGKLSLSAASLESTKSDRSSLGDWMGSLWGKPRHKHQRPPLPPSQDEIFDSDPILPGEPSHDVPPSSPSSIKPGRRKVSRSVFGTLGFSILNPVSATPGKKGHRPSTTDASTLTTQPPATYVDVPKLPTALSSPVSTAFTPSIPAAPSLTTELQHSGVLSQTPSLHSLRTTVERQPQGSALPAIVNATRVMTSGPNSVLVEHGAGTSAFIAKLAYELVKAAREEGIEIRAPSKERRDRRQDREHDQSVNPKATIVKSTGIDVATSLSRALSGPEDVPTVKAKSRTTAFSPPSLSSFLQQQQRRPPAHADRNPRHNSNPTESSQPSQNNASTAQPAVRQNKSVPLESIIPATFKPPTEYLSRAYTPLTAQDFRPYIVGPVALPPLPTHRADSEPLVDRFGFMYDIALYDVLLLVRARTCRCAAPACLTGVKIADRTEDEWSDEEADVAGIEIIKESSCPCNGEIELPARPQSRTSSTSGRRHSNAASSGGGDISVNNSSITNSNSSSKAAPLAGASPCMAILAVGPDTPRHVCANVVRRLLSELTAIHDERQAVQRKDWDAFVRAQRRSRAQTLPTPSPSGGGSGSVSGGVAALLGLDGPVAEDELAHSDGLIGFTQLGRSAGREERRELGRLVRGGVPLAYRAKVWLESSGGLEIQEPGVFAELLAQTDSDGGSVVREIDKDVGRTMPLNMFFGGDGVGVQKLRRVLIAYSRCVSPFPPPSALPVVRDFGFDGLLGELDEILQLGTVKV